MERKNIPADRSSGWKLEKTLLGGWKLDKTVLRGTESFNGSINKEKINLNLFRKWKAEKNVLECRKIGANLPAIWNVIGNLQEGF